MKMADLSAILATPIAAIIDGKRTHKPLGHIAAHESITALYDVFRHNDVGGVFVYKTIEKDGKTSKEYIAIITILQVMSYFADIIDDLSNLASSYLLRLIRTTTVEKVLEALGGEGSRTWVAPEGKVSLAELMEVLSGGISRVLVPVGVDGDGETMYDVCTHRDVLLYLYHNFDNDPMLQTQADSNLLDLGLTNDQDIESSHSTVISVGLEYVHLLAFNL
ncbi:hypothetical protein HK104_002452 [Borealophlyctis nickersoniae]|nr:hypothetical protein HK104_002452 [Borealophlyctis nickersoniae]